MTDDRDAKPENDELLVGAPYHVYPVGKGHEVEGGPTCWCKPKVEEDGRLIIHNDQVA